MFASVGVGDKEYKLLAKVSDFTKDGWKLEALRNENATLVPVSYTHLLYNLVKL